MTGGTISIYLLENVRVVNQQHGDQNFHIFYQMLLGANDEQLQSWKLTKSTQDYNYLMNRKFTSGERNSKVLVTHKIHFHELRKNFVGLNFQSDTIDLIFQIMAGLLHLGQVQFNGVFSDGEEGSQVVPDPSLMNTATLCGFDAGALSEVLTSKLVISRGEEFKKKLTPTQAINARDAVAKIIYQKVFEFITAEINTHIEDAQDRFEVRSSLSRSGDYSMSRSSRDSSSEIDEPEAHVGVLDIFGFESFVKNSLEQLCINYANESLHQQFSTFVYKQELLEYKKEKIEFETNFVDNQECLDLIGGRIFKIMDDQCRIPDATDKRLSSIFYKELTQFTQRFSSTSTQQVHIYPLYPYIPSIPLHTLSLPFHTLFLDIGTEPVPGTPLCRHYSVFVRRLYREECQ